MRASAAVAAGIATVLAVAAGTATVAATVAAVTGLPGHCLQLELQLGRVRGLSGPRLLLHLQFSVRERLLQHTVASVQVRAVAAVVATEAAAVAVATGAAAVAAAAMGCLRPIRLRIQPELVRVRGLPGRRLLLHLQRAVRERQLRHLRELDVRAAAAAGGTRAAVPAARVAAVAPLASVLSAAAFAATCSTAAAVPTAAVPSDSVRQRPQL